MAPVEKVKFGFSIPQIFPYGPVDMGLVRDVVEERGSPRVP